MEEFYTHTESQFVHGSPNSDYCCLHSRYCMCLECCPGFGSSNTAGRYAYNTLVIPWSHWIEMGKPKNIEEYYESSIKKKCPCCGHSFT